MGDVSSFLLRDLGATRKLRLEALNRQVRERNSMKQLTHNYYSNKDSSKNLLLSKQPSIYDITSEFENPFGTSLASKIMTLHSRKQLSDHNQDENKRKPFRVNLEATYLLNHDFPMLSKHSSKVHLQSNILA
jgi:uncharacterized protein YcgL (UPF0745 family)